MADVYGVKISELPESEDIFEGCCLPIVTMGETHKVTYGQLKNKLQEDLIESDPTVPAYVKEISQSKINEWDGKSDFNGDYGNLFNVPEEFNPSPHNHDDRYYTKTEIDSQMSEKVDHEDGKGLSTNDFTDADKAKVDNALVFEAQTLTDAQKTQSRTNIEAAASDDLVKTNQRLENLIKANEGTTFDYQSDTTVANPKFVPEEALPYAELNKIYGRTLKMLQLIQNGNFSDETNGWSKTSGVDMWSVTNHILYAKIEDDTRTSYVSQSVGTVIGHNYLFILEARAITGTLKASINHGASNTFTISDTLFATYSAIFTATQDTANIYPLRRTADGLGTVEGECKVAMLIDLTTMEQELLTAETFKSVYPKDYYAQGQYLINFTADKVVSTGTDLHRELALPTATYFPTKMKSAGTARDVLDVDRQVAKTVIGSVDLGSLKWNRNSSYDNPVFISTDIANLISLEDAEIIKCANYSYAKYPMNASDKTMSTHSTFSFGNLIIRDDAYSNPTAFKNAMNGVMLYYELATPTETPITPPLDWTLEVEGGGTVTMLNGEEYSIPNEFDVNYEVKL